MKRGLKWVALGVGLPAVLLAILQVLPARGVVPGQNVWRPRPDGRPLVIAHGGGQGLRPANTLEAFAHGVEIGCDVLEMDLRLTRDGVLVTHHDETIDRTSDGRGRVVEFTLAELKAWNFGFSFRDPAGGRPYREQPARIATLDEVFQRHPGMPMVVELKDRGEVGAKAAAALAQLIARHQRAAGVIVAAFDDVTLDEFRRQTGGLVATAAPQERTRRFVILSKLGLDWLAPAGDHALQIPMAASGLRLDTPGLVRAAHRRNRAVHYWTINDAAEMKRLISLGADGLMTDRPDRLFKVLAEMGR